MRWEDAVEGYWLSKARHVSDATIADYNGTFRRFGKWIKKKPVEDVTVKDVDAFLSHLDEDLHLAPKTVQNAWIALSSFWTWAAKDLGWRHIMRDVEKPKAWSQPMLAYSEEEVRRLLDACGRMRAYSPATEQHTQVGDGVRNALTTAVATGIGPRETARLVRRQFGMGLKRALTIARTEQLRAYREAARRTYEQNADVLEGWTWLSGGDGRTSPSCLAMHGTVHPVTEGLASPPQLPLYDGAQGEGGGRARDPDGRGALCRVAGSAAAAHAGASGLRSLQGGCGAPGGLCGGEG